MDAVRRSFRAMGTEITLVAPAEADPAVVETATARMQRRFAHEEQRFSRFRADSELSRVNASAGEWTPVSAGFARLTRFALEAAWRTGGRFDPTVLPAMIAAGYDRDFDEVLAGARGALHPAEPCGRFTELELEAHRLRMPDDVALDFGGVAKGWTVDLAAEAALWAGLPWVIVNAGGDLRLDGDVPSTGVEVGVEDPQDRATELLRVSISEGALATSSTLVRSWGAGLHHLIDPRTGAPADGDVVQATVWAETCAEAEVRSKWALLEGPIFLERAHAVLVMSDGRIVMNLEQAAPMEVSA
jgi:thiamine biosynthesis lipoprotein